MTQLLNHSDINSIRSANEEAFFRGPAKAPPPALACPAADRADCARVAHRDLQALRPTQLSLRRRTGTRPQALPVHNRSNRRTPAARLCAEWRVSSGGRVSRQLPQAPGDAQRDLRDQCRASASSRKSRLDGPGGRSPRLCGGGRHHRQHDRLLSRCRRSAARCGRTRS